MLQPRVHLSSSTGMDQTIPIHWPSVIQDLSPGLLSYFKACLPYPVASEAVQETLLRLYAKTRDGAFCAAEGSLRMYAYGIARHVRLETLRSDRKSRLTDSLDASIDPPAAPETPATLDDNRQWLRWAITHLKPVEQEVLLLLLDRELEHAAIAEILGMATGTVKSHAHRAKLHLIELRATTEMNEKR